MFSSPKMSNMVKAKIFRKVFAFKQTKEHILLQVQPLKMLSGIQANFLRPCSPKYSTYSIGSFKGDILELESNSMNNNMAQLGVRMKSNNRNF